MPRTLTKQHAVTQHAVTQHAVTPHAVTPRAVTPRAVTPPAVTRPAEGRPGEGRPGRRRQVALALACRRRQVALALAAAVLLIAGTALLVAKMSAGDPGPVLASTDYPGPVLATPGDPGPVLASVSTSGGLCPWGPCSGELTVNRDGTWRFERGPALRTGRLNQAQLAQVAEAVRTTGLGSAPRATELCPAAYDGQERVYTWSADGPGVHAASSCSVVVPADDPLVRELDALSAMP